MCKYILVLLSAVLFGTAEGVLAKVCYKTGKSVIPVHAICFGLITLLLHFRYGFSFDFFWGIVFLAVTLFFSTKDVLCREVSDWMHISVFLLGCVHLSADTWKSMVFGFFVCSVPMLIIALLKKGGVGGADIKCMAAIGWAFGWEKSLLIVVVACILSLIGTIIVSVVKRKKIKSAPMVPYICASAILVYGLL